MSMEGKITIDLDRGTANNPEGPLVLINSSRRTNIAEFLNGKQPQEAAALLPLIFSICGKAHAHAAATACRQSKLTGKAETAGSLIVLCENAREHLLRILTGWNSNGEFDVGQIPFQEVMGLVGEMQLAVGGGTHIAGARVRLDVASIKQIATQISQFLQSHVFHLEPQFWLKIASDSQLADWAKQTDTIAGKFVLNLYKQNWQSAGAAQARFLPDIAPADLSMKMHAGGSDGFVNQPDWQGRTYETGPLARNCTHHLIGNLTEQYGSGLLTRQVARLVDLAKIPAEIEQLVLPENNGNVSGLPRGIGQVETARGQLTHSVIIKNDKITDYKILAPTEWNFHPDGTAHDSLKTLCTAGSCETEKLAKMIVEAIDPCVAFEVRVH